MPKNTEAHRGVPKSASKTEFMKRLGFTEDDPTGKQICKTMMKEAAAARARLVENRDNLKPQNRNDPNIKPPFASSEIMETAIHREVLVIVANASPETRPFYLHGQYEDGSNSDNWVARWFLNRSFRNACHARSPKSAVSSSTTAVNDKLAPVKHESRSSSAGVADSGPLPPMRSLSSLAQEQPQNVTYHHGAPIRQQQSSGYWDPVRNV